MDANNLPVYSDAKERVLNAAESLFQARGLKSVTLRDIARAVGINHTTLYHHIPGGKEALFVEVMQRAFARSSASLTDVMKPPASGHLMLSTALGRASRWMLGQPPIDFIRMLLADMPALSPELSRQLSADAFDAYLKPFVEVFSAAHTRGEIRMISDPTILAGAFLAIVQSVHAAPTADHGDTQKEHMVDEIIDVLLNGLRL